MKYMYGMYKYMYKVSYDSILETAGGDDKMIKASEAGFNFSNGVAQLFITLMVIGYNFHHRLPLPEAILHYR